MKFEFFSYLRETFRAFIEIATYTFFFSFTFFYLLFHLQRNQRRIRDPTRERNLTVFREQSKKRSFRGGEGSVFLSRYIFFSFLFFISLLSVHLSFFSLRSIPFRSKSRLHDNALIKKRCLVVESTAVFRAMGRNKISTLFRASTGPHFLGRNLFVCVRDTKELEFLLSSLSRPL